MNLLKKNIKIITYKKTLIKNNGLESLDKTLSSKYNYKYKLKQISIKKIQTTYILIL